MPAQLIIGIQPDRAGEESYSDKWTEFLIARGVQVRTVNLLAPDALRQARRCDGIMWRWIHHPQEKQSAKRILHTIEHCLHIPVLPDTRTAWHYDDKVAQYYLLRAIEAPVPETWLFWERSAAMQWAESAPYPVVLKLACGAGSSNVVKVGDESVARRLIEQLFCCGIFPCTMNEWEPGRGIPRSRSEAAAMVRRGREALRYLLCAEYPALHPQWWQLERGYAYFQEYLDGNDFDTRITVIGNRAFGLRRFNRPNDFRASGSGSLSTDPELIDEACVDIAFEMSRRGGFQSMAYDFLHKDSRPVISEISYTFLDRAVRECPGQWDGHLKWTEGQMWPEEAQVELFLKTVESRGMQPHSLLSGAS